MTGLRLLVYLSILTAGLFMIFSHSLSFLLFIDRSYTANSFPKF